jgi:predicted O-methyltransferase YrrM
LRKEAFAGRCVQNEIAEKRSPMDTTAEILTKIRALPESWHGAGTVPNVVLERLAELLETRRPKVSVETGTGRSTLLFSHLSANHTVFCFDDRAEWNSYGAVQESELLDLRNTKFVLGPTQITLKNYVFTEPIDLAFIDGPHGYPFPDLEYYYFYPHIAVGGLLLIDDINIPSIKSMFEIIRAGDMFELVQVVEYTAFLRRTEAPLIDPLSDSWFLQGVNRPHYEYLMAVAQHSPSSRLRLVTRLIPPQLKRLVPQSWKKGLLKAWVRLTGS